MDINALHNQVKQELAVKDAEMLSAIDGAYNASYSQMARQAAQLTAKVREMQAAGKKINLKSMPEYRKLIQNQKKLAEQCSNKSAVAITHGQTAYGAKGRRDAFTLAGEPQGWRNSTAKLPSGKINIEGRKPVSVSDFLAHHNEKTLAELEKTVSNGITQGLTPEQVAARIRNIGVSAKSHAELTAKTETMKCYNSAQQDAYATNPDIVNGKVWRCQHTSNTCAACWSMDGQFFALDAEPSFMHPSCNCIMLPALQDGDGATEFKPDETFKQLPEDAQKKILGEDGYNLFKEGRVELSDFGTTKENGMLTKQTPEMLEKIAANNSTYTLADLESKYVESTNGEHPKSWEELDKMQISKENALSLLEQHFSTPNEIQGTNADKGDLYCPRFCFDDREERRKYWKEPDRVLSEKRVAVFAKLVESAFPVKKFDFKGDSIYYPEWLQETKEMYCLRSGFMYGYTKGNSLLRNAQGKEIKGANGTKSESRSREHQVRFACQELGGGKHANTQKIVKDYDRHANPAARVAVLSTHQYTQQAIREGLIDINGCVVFRGTGHRVSPKEWQSVDSTTTSRRQAERYATLARDETGNGIMYGRKLTVAEDAKHILFTGQNAQVGLGRQISGFTTGYQKEEEIIMLYNPNAQWLIKVLPPKNPTT